MNERIETRQQITPSTAYRTDIDGLRGVAIILVLLFHANWLFPGGFIGVDVFFVISGFIITRNLAPAALAGNLNLRTFFIRRVLRLIPPAAVMTAATLLAGFWMMHPNDLIDLGTSVLYQQAFAGNIYFWRNTGYFDTSAELMPLLHTWSLAIEEQFYLFHPFLVCFICRMNIHRRTWLLLTLLALCFLLSHYGTLYHRSAAFYLLPTRAWELLLGATLFFIQFDYPYLNHLPKPVINTFSISGSLLILFPAVQYTNSTSFPGINSLTPCLGTALLIIANSTCKSFASSILEHSLLNLIGRWSYSLYLWHWPTFAYARALFGSQPTFFVMSVCIILTFILAGISYNVIEKPFRSKVPRWPRLMIVAVTAMPIILCITSLAIHNWQGFPNRLSAISARYGQASESMAFIHEVSLSELESSNLPRFGAENAPIECVIWGDSHAMALIPAFDAAFKTLKIAGRQATLSSTPPLMSESSQRTRVNNKVHQEFNSAVLTHIQTTHPQFAVLAAMWSDYAIDDQFLPRLQHTIKELESAGSTVILVLDVAQQPFDVPRTLSRRSQVGLPTWNLGTSDIEYQRRNRACNQQLRYAAGKTCKLVDPGRVLKNGSGQWLQLENETLLYRDDDHLSIEGALLLSDEIRELFRTLIKDSQKQ
jgi:peptidoglycan/LPS O-acetylase OafA/YrhL